MADDWLTTEQKKINKLSPWFFLTRGIVTMVFVYVIIIILFFLCSFVDIP